MKTLIIGARGQLGQAFQATDNPRFVYAPAVRVIGLPALFDLVKNSDASAVINCTAWTDVRGAERTENAGAVYSLNWQVPSTLAQICAHTKKRFLTFSTDYVFEGKKSVPYHELDPVFPLNTYGRSKLAGEVAAELGGLVIRTAGLYSPYGPNFIRMICDRLKDGKPFTVTDRLTTSITDAKSLAAIALRALDAGLTGVYHFANSPGLTWFEIALEIAYLSGVLDDRIKPGPPSDTVRRPVYSVLDSAKIRSALGMADRSDRWEVRVKELINSYA